MDSVDFVSTAGAARWERHLPKSTYSSLSWGLQVVRIKKAFSDAAISIGALAVLLALLISVDQRVREQVSLRFNTDTAQSEVNDAAGHVRDVAMVLFDAARDQTIAHAPMMIFVSAATVLMVFMLRT